MLVLAKCETTTHSAKICVDDGLIVDVRFFRSRANKAVEGIVSDARQPTASRFLRSLWTPRGKHDALVKMESEDLLWTEFNTRGAWLKT